MITLNLIGLTKGHSDKGTKRLSPRRSVSLSLGRFVPLSLGRFVALSLGLLVSLSLSSFAAGPGTTTGELLKIPVGARAIGMGEAYTAEANDTSALYWNPAGLTYAEQKEATFMHSSLIEGIHYEHLSYMAPGETYSYGAGMSYLGYGSIAGYDNSGGTIGDQSAYSYIFNGGVARRFKDVFSFGLTGAYLSEKLADTSAGTFVANLGGIYDMPFHPLMGNYKVALAAQNLGNGLKFVSDRAPLPRKFKMGFSAAHIKEWPLTLTMDITNPNDNSTYIGIGSEYWFRELIALRLGYSGSNDEGRGLRMGVGLKLRGLLFDYAYGSFGDFGATHRIGISFRYGTRIKQMNEGQRALLKEAKRSLKEGDDMAAIMKLDEMLQKDPDNHLVLKQMIAAHENILKKDLNEAVAKSTSEEAVPSPEEFALQDLVPGQEKVAQNATLAPGGFNPDDPLNLNSLPDPKNLDGLAGEALPSPEASAIAPTVSAPAQPAAIVAPISAPSPAAAPEASQPVSSEPAATNTGDGPMLNPADFQ